MRSCFNSNRHSIMPLFTECDGGVVRVSVVSDLGQANISAGYRTTGAAFSPFTPRG